MPVPVIAVIAAIDAVSAVKAAVDKVTKATADGDFARSVILIVENNLHVPLEKIHENHEHGGWFVDPSGTIPPNSVVVFSSRSNGVATGTAGLVEYAIRDKTPEDSVLQIEWNNPFVGSNKADAFAWANGGHSPHKASDLYHASKSIGTGDKHVQMRYSLLPRV
jgi:hypothetical protein